MKKFFLLSFLVLHLLSAQLYFLPFESRDAMHQLLRWIDQAHYKIDIAMYSFTNKKIAKRLVNAAKRGVKIRLILDEEQNLKDRYSQIGYLAKYPNIAVFTIKGKYAKRGEYYGKMHMKLAIIDNKRLIFGSANWSNSAFKRNYELLYFLDDLQKAKKSERFFERILRKAKEY
ncbi:phospholipase D-like domain-containing protein [Nitratiruptor sp. YY09-18]|uniref:phospholipase D-like domain-containing protein n=1 Tax=Nitratiruptor sp. YY09-18 TaxID=2724901 RepID=UPI0019161B27|nr:phospholipase D-like domain-containing protein [Nitratiruptor sp. YY09-18]BCD68599.1 hypothetical protein NitYY0918_C1516 [Nitratiruptor sp. YY09-18]